MKKIIFLITLFLCQIITSQEFELGEKSITGIFDVKGKSKSEIFSSINRWISLNYNSSKDIIQLNDKESGTIIVKGINISTFENARRKFYKNQY